MILPLHEPRCLPDQPGDFCHRCARYDKQPWQICQYNYTPHVRVIGPWSPVCMRVPLDKEP